MLSKDEKEALETRYKEYIDFCKENSFVKLTFEEFVSIEKTFKERMEKSK